MTEQGAQKSNWRRIVSSRSFVLAVIFCVGLIVFEYFLFRPTDAVRVFTRHSADANYPRLLAFWGMSATGVILSFAFFWAAFSSSYLLRAIYLLIFAFTTAVEYSLFGAFSRFSRLSDLVTAMLGIDTRIGAEAIAMYFSALSLIPVGIFLVLLLFTRSKQSRGIGSLALIVALYCGFFSLTTYFTKNLFYTGSLSTSFRTAVSFPIGWYIGTIDGPPEGVAYGAPREPVSYHAPEPPRNNVVFIVDESIRGDRLSINGHTAATTPTLESLQKTRALANWGVAAAGTTCSHTANPLMLTGLSELPDKSFQIYRMPTIFQYAKAMGYKTSYYDGQVNSLWNGKPADIPDFGDWVLADEILPSSAHRYEIDAEIGRRLRETLRSSTGNFIWVNKFGVHTPYINSFPNEHYGEKHGGSDYDPRFQEAAIGGVYDSAITYNLESFFKELLADGPAAETFYVYTSDHGQTLRENGATVSHCAESKGEANVPLFMIAALERMPAVDTTFRASHSNIFATLLDLMNYPENERKYSYPLSLLKAKGTDSAPRFYYSNELAYAVKHAFD